MSAPEATTSTDPVIRVHCASWREFAEQFADDIVSGGLYLSSSSAPALLSTLEVVLQLPEATEINLRARVVQVVSGEQARQLGKEPGMGLELLDIDPERKRQIVQLIEFARWQGSNDDPKTSFARTLLELSPSLPPAEIGYRLSLLPSPNARPESRPLFPAQNSTPARPSAVPVSRQAEASAPPVGHSTAPRRSTAGPVARPSATAGDPRPRGESYKSLRPPARHPSARDSQKSLRSPNQPSAHDSQKSLKAPAAANSASPRSSDSQRNMPATEHEQRAPGHSDRALPGAASDVPTRGESQTVLSAADTAVNPAAPPVAARPTDQQKLKLVLSNFAHKQYEAALRVTRDMLEANPGDPQAQRWQAQCNARLALTRNEPTVACAHYERVLHFDPEQREAREFIRMHQRDKKLASIPFGRYFTKKK